MLLFLNDHQSIPNAITNINSFSKVSGTLLNFDKCERLPLNQHGVPKNDLALQCVKTSKCLGLQVGFDEKIKKQKNWDDKLDVIRKTLEQWQYRDLTVYGKVLVLKMYGSSTITFSVG